MRIRANHSEGIRRNQAMPNQERITSYWVKLLSSLKDFFIQFSICVRRVLPEETRLFLDNNNQLISRIDELTRLLNDNGTTPVFSGGGSQKTTPT